MRVVVADDSAVVREGVTRILTAAGVDVVGQARSADECLDLVDRHRPDLAVVDIRMPPSEDAGLLVAERVRERHGTAVGVLVLSQHLEPAYALRLLAHGGSAVGYLLKDRVGEPDELVEAVRRVAGGGSAVDGDVVAELARGRRNQDRLARLTARERTVLSAMAEGRSNRSIAEREHLSVKTVESVIASIFAKLDLEPAATDNRRVLAVLTHLDSAAG